MVHAPGSGGISLKSIVFAAAAALVAAPVVAAPAKPLPKDAKVWAAAEAARPEQLKLLQQVVDIDSGTRDVDGGKKVAAIFIERLKALGYDIQSVKAEADGLPDNTVATLKGTGKGRILLIGHLDTVFGPGTVAKWSFHADADKAYGPGVGDEKGGVVEGIMALKILRDLDFKDFKQITLLIETSEEGGSPGTQDLIRKLDADADVEFNLEPGDTPDVLTVWRKGSTAVHIDVTGRAAHAGVAPQEGRNAITELIHQIAGADAFPKSGDGITLNVTGIKGGTRDNIIPDEASATFSLRIREKPQLDQVMAVLEKNAQSHAVPDTTVRVYHQERFFPPLASNTGTDALAERAEAIYGGIGKTIARGGNGGASESALAYEGGIPALDGLGPAGGGFHSDKEYILLNTVTPRLYLLTKLIETYGAQPPARLK
jgi:glutamate carboxypeptidase